MDDGMIYIPILFLFISVILLILTVFWLFYYNNDNWAMILFGIGILLGLIACIMLVYLRWPDQLQRDKVAPLELQRDNVAALELQQNNTQQTDIELQQMALQNTDDTEEAALE